MTGSRCLMHQSRKSSYAYGCNPAQWTGMPSLDASLDTSTCLVHIARPVTALSINIGGHAITSGRRLWPGRPQPAKLTVDWNCLLLTLSRRMAQWPGVGELWQAGYGENRSPDGVVSGWNSAQILGELEMVDLSRGVRSCTMKCFTYNGVE